MLEGLHLHGYRTGTTRNARDLVHCVLLGLRVNKYEALQRWELMQVVAKVLSQWDPDNPQWSVAWAYATRRTDSLEAARLILVNAVARQPEVAVFHFNLACYDCQLGLLDGARRRLQRAFELEPRSRLRALEDSDLEPLWASLRG